MTPFALAFTASTALSALALPPITGQVVGGLWDVAAAVVLALVVLAGTHLWGFRAAFEREVGVALVRGFVQLAVMGSILVFLLSLPLPASVLVLLGMMAGGALIARNRATGFPEAFRVAAVAILVGAGLTIAAMVATGLLSTGVRDLLPVGSMIIANGMKTASLAFDQFGETLDEHRPQVEALLALGVPAEQTVDRYLKRGVESSLVPVVDSIKSLGWVWIPGLMAGMVLSGANPLYAAEYQFAVMTAIFAASALTSLVCGFLLRSRAFTDADRLRDFSSA